MSVITWEKGKKKKLQLTTTRCIQAPRSQNHPKQECHTQRKHTHKDLSWSQHTSEKPQWLETLPGPRRLSCFVFPEKIAHREVTCTTHSDRPSEGKLACYIYTHKLGIHTKYTLVVGILASNLRVKIKTHGWCLQAWQQSLHDSLTSMRQ